MKLVTDFGAGNLQLLNNPINVVTLSDSTTYDPSPAIENTEIVRLFVSAAGVKLNIAKTPDSANAITIDTGESFYPMRKGEKICVYGGDVEMSY